jgi:hypothetical protein
MPDCPGLTVAPDEAPAQQELREAVPGAKEILFGGLSAAAQVTNRLLVRRGRVDLGEGARSEQQGELARVATIGLDTLPRLNGNQRRGDDLADDPLT